MSKKLTKQGVYSLYVDFGLGLILWPWICFGELSKFERVPEWLSPMSDATTRDAKHGAHDTASLAMNTT